MSKLFGAMALVAVLGFGGACSSEDDCVGDTCSEVERQPPDDEPRDTNQVPPPCEQVCSVLDECGVSDDDTCMNACTAGAYTDAERVCLAGAGCGDAIGICLNANR